LGAREVKRDVAETSVIEKNRDKGIHRKQTKRRERMGEGRRAKTKAIWNARQGELEGYHEAYQKTVVRTDEN